MRSSTWRGSSVVALGAAAAVLIIVVGVTTPEPLRALQTFVSAPFTSRYAFGNTLSSAGLLLFAGAGVIAALRSGHFNLGGEGQLYVAATVTAVVAAGSTASPAVALLVGAATAALMAAACGLLRTTTGADELITTFLLSAAAFPVTDYLITGPLRDATSSLLATPRIADSARLVPILPPSTLTVAAPLAVATTLVLWFAGERTMRGYEVRMMGHNRELARYAGINVARHTIASLGLSGALHGVAGGLLVLGTHGRAIQGFSGGIGWNAIAVALIARNRYPLLIPAALLFAWLDTGSRAAVFESGATWELGSIVQAVVFLFVTAAFSRRRLGVGRG